MMKLVGLSILFCILLVLPLANSELEVGFEEGRIGLDLIPTPATPINYSLIPTVNRSDFWDLLDTPDDFSWSQYSGLNDSIDARTSSTTYLADNLTTYEGTLDSGNVTSIQSAKDGDSYNVSEDAGASPLKIIINFTGVVDFNTIILRELYEGGQGHEIAIGLYDYTTDSYEEEYGELTDMEILAFLNIPVLDATDHISGGVVSLQLDHVQNGINAHNFFLDYAVLVDGFSTITTSEHDALTGRDDQNNHPWAVPYTNATKNIDLGNKNITTTGHGEFGEEGVKIKSSETASYLSLRTSGLGEQSSYLEFDLENEEVNTVLHLNAEDIFLGDWFDQSVKTGSSPTFANVDLTGSGVLGLGNFDMNEGGGQAIVVKNQDSGERFLIAYQTKDGDGTDYCAFDLYAKHTTNAEYIQHGWNPAGYFQTRIVEEASGSIQDYKMWSTGNVDQFKLVSDGSIVMATAVDDDVSNPLATYWNSATGQIGFSSSSERYKENIRDLPDNISSKIFEVRATQYDKINGSKDNIGMIAEEVNELFPECIAYRREAIWGECENINSVTNETYYEDCIINYKLEINKTTGKKIPEAINYDCLLTPLIKEVQNLNERIKFLEENCILK